MLAMYKNNEIAVVGFALRFPNANNKDEFWENLKNGVDCISHDGFENNSGDTVYSFGRLDNIYGFDANFFGISEREAEIMDPQQRFLITLCHEAMEDAGHKISENNKIGIFAGTGDFYYVWDNVFSGGCNPEDAKLLRTTYLDGSFTLKASYVLGLTGPSLPIKAGCASGLTAIHLAIQSLLNHECDFALAGGVSINENQSGYQPAEGTLSGSGTVRPFDNYADGFVPGNGAGIVVLRRMEDSLADKDHIHAVIKGSAINNDGKRKSGYSAPSVQGESQAIEDAIRKSGVSYEDVSYIETHGTATKLGDIIEVEALKRTYGKNKPTDNFARIIGSVKSNVGHLNYAAGVAGFIKTVLMLENKKLVPTINYQQENKNLELNEYHIAVNKAFRDWKGKRRIGAVSSFGIGGSNCHVILEEYNDEVHNENEELSIIPLSAKSKESVKRMTNNLIDYCTNNNDSSINDLAFTLQFGREEYQYRAAYVAGSKKALIETMNEPTPIYTAMDSYDYNSLFMFAGSNSYQKKDIMTLMQKNKHLKTYFKEAFDCVKKVTGFDMTGHLFSNNDDTFFNYMITFCTQYALGKFTEYIGIAPGAVIGYSAGEYMAAYFANVLSLEDTFNICNKRFELFSQIEESTMISVMSSVHNIKDLLSNSIEVSAINSPERIMVSGPKSDMEEFENNLKKNKVIYVKLPLARAGHCSMVKKILKPMEEFLSTITFNRPDITFVSTYLGRVVHEDEITSTSYWVNQTLNMVNFQKAVEGIKDIEGLIAIEMGMGEQLCSFFSKSSKGINQYPVSLITDKVDDKEEALYHAIGRIWSLGGTIDWSRLNNTSGKIVSLPTYPFDYKEFRKKVFSKDQKGNDFMDKNEIVVVDGFSQEREALSEFLLTKYKKVNIVTVDKIHVMISKLEDIFKELEESIVESSEIKCMAEVDGLYETYDKLCISVASDYFKNYELFVREAEDVSIDEIEERTGIIDEYKPLLMLLLKYLEKYHYIARVNVGNWRTLQSINNVEPIEKCVEKESQVFPEFMELMNLLVLCDKNYPEVLSGKISGKEILYPNGSYDLIRKVYNNTPTYGKSNLYSIIFSHIIKRLADEKHGKFRILEIGAGTGIVTWPAVNNLINCDYEYWFSDIGRTFIFEAKKKAEIDEIKNMKFMKADVTKNLTLQDIPSNYFDIVVSCGVIQSLPDMEDALKNMKEVLRDGGVISLLQPINTHEIRELFGGLTPEWWNYKSDELRANGYNISTSDWKELLIKNEFKDVVILDGTEKCISDSSIILGQLRYKEKTDNGVGLHNQHKGKVKEYVVESFESLEFNELISKWRKDDIEILYPSNFKLKQKCEDKDDIQDGKVNKEPLKALIDKNIDIKLCQLLKEILGIEEIDFSKSLFELDIDSLTGLMLVTKINELFQIKVTTKELISCSSLQKLSTMIQKKMN